MTTPAQVHLAVAEERATEARKRLSTTIGQLQARLDPKLLAEDARQAGIHAAKAGIDSARRNPGIVTGALALASLLIARRQVAGWLSRRKRKSAKPLSASSKGTLP